LFFLLYSLLGVILSCIKDNNKNASVSVQSCTFTECYASGEGGAIWGELGTDAGSNNFEIKESLFVNCTASSGKAQAVYLKVPSANNENFKFDRISLTYTTSTSEPILFLYMYSLVGIVDGSSADRLNTFKSKFVDFCANPPNTTSFIVYDAESLVNYTLPELICDREGVYFILFFLFIIV
jgi:hypothetical protein